MLPDRMFTTFRTAAQGLAVQREKIAVAGRNIAHANTSSRPGNEGVYRPQSVVTSLGEEQNFQRMLLDNVQNLQQANAPRRLDANGNNGNPQAAFTHNLGPQIQVVETDAFRYEFDPNHPDADQNGMVRYPDIDLITEMTQLISANRLYEANLSVVEAEKQIIRRSLEI
ncbi:MAG: flagellar basal body rod protein FlgC [Bacteroidetes bacterium]|nr:flagellar basal body rod protein FlgC [Bacteroidota bacterium]MCH8523838.1 hypothetical protein [Balneolales bacterium]